MNLYKVFWYQSYWRVSRYCWRNLPSFFDEQLVSVAHYRSQQRKSERLINLSLLRAGTILLWLMTLSPQKLKQRHFSNKVDNSYTFMPKQTSRNLTNSSCSCDDDWRPTIDLITEPRDEVLDSDPPHLYSTIVISMILLLLLNSSLINEGCRWGW